MEVLGGVGRRTKGGLVKEGAAAFRSNSAYDIYIYIWERRAPCSSGFNEAGNDLTTAGTIGHQFHFEFSDYFEYLLFSSEKIRATMQNCNRTFAPGELEKSVQQT